MFRACCVSLFLVTGLFAQPAVEIASLRDFLSGTEPACAYDNWISHIVEGIARPGYNVYAPEALDPQLNGFGHFEVISDDAGGDEILALFSDMADHLLAGDAQTAWELLQEWPNLAYELIELQDPILDRTFYVLREELDPSFFDPGYSGSFTDDVHGSFQKGWGIFVFNPAGLRPRLVVEVPHPNDDHLSPFIGTDFFLESDAGLLMMNGAGREVEWSGNTYTNGASLSDPTRNCRLPFAVIHERVVEFWRNQGLLECVFQLHSYDDESHRDLKSCVVSGGRYRRQNLQPIYDPGRSNLGLLNNLDHPVWESNSLGFAHGDVGIPTFAATQALRPLRVDGDAGEDVLVPISVNLWGYPGSCQELCSHDNVPDCNRLEEWIHVELDELPLPAHSLGDDFWYGNQGVTVANMANYEQTRIYYEPLFMAYLEAWDALEAVTTTAPPTDPSDLQLSGITNDGFILKWEPTQSSFFSTYELYVDDSGMITPNARIMDSSDINDLCWAPLDRVEVDGLEYQNVYAVTLRARDAQGRLTGYSNTIQAMPDDLEPPIITVPSSSTALWIPAGGGTIQMRLRDSHHDVDLSDIEWRVDIFQNESYGDPGETWQATDHTGEDNDAVLDFTTGALSPGLHSFEVRAHDNQHEIWGYSGRDQEEGIQDDFMIMVDPDPPNAFSGTITVGEILPDATLSLSWNAQSSDTTFYSYRILVGREPISQPDDAERILDRSHLTDLGDSDTREIELDPLAWLGETVYVSMDMIDRAGNVGSPSLATSFDYYNPAWCESSIEAYSIGNGRLGLSWETECPLGDLSVQGWWVHQLTDPHEEPSPENRIFYSVDNSCELETNLLPSIAFFRVVADIQLP